MTFNEKKDEKCRKTLKLPFRYKKVRGECYLLNKEDCKEAPKSRWLNDVKVCIPKNKYFKFRKAQLQALIKGDKDFSNNIKLLSELQEESLNDPPSFLESIRDSILSITSKNYPEKISNRTSKYFGGKGKTKRKNIKIKTQKKKKNKK